MAPIVGALGSDGCGVMHDVADYRIRRVHRCADQRGPRRRAGFGYPTRIIDNANGLVLDHVAEIGKPAEATQFVAGLIDSGPPVGARLSFGPGAAAKQQRDRVAHRQSVVADPAHLFGHRHIHVITLRERENGLT